MDVPRGFRHFLCGMARGGDFYFAELVTQLRVKHPEVTLEAVIPYREQSRHWEPADRRRYLALVKSCNAVTILQEASADPSHCRPRAASPAGCR